MTKKDYELIAKVLSQKVNKRRGIGGETAEIIYLFCTSLEKDNPKFNREKFIIACYGEK